jgi:hypothetical protein
MKSRIEAGTKVRVDQGFGRFTEGVVVSFSTAKNRLGNPNNYVVRVTGGVNVFGRPERVGYSMTVHQDHVSEAA